MERFYIPFNHKIGNITLIIYPAKDENPLKNIIKSEPEIIQNLNKLYSKNKGLNTGTYHIVFIWSYQKKLMFDVWIHDIESATESGPLIDCLTFKEFELSTDTGIASGDSIFVLGREDELRRQSSNLDSYLNRMIIIPNFPGDFKPTIRF